MPTTTSHPKAPINIGDKIPTPNEFAPLLQLRFTALGYQPDTALYSITIADIVTILTARLAESGIQPAELMQDELEGLVDQISAYLNGEGMPWNAMVNLGIREAWPERLNHVEAT